jgi:hypothetical protein
MSVTELTERLMNEAASGQSTDWRAVRDEIIKEHENATTTRERVMCLSLYKWIMDAVEPSIQVENMGVFKEARTSDYRLLLFREAMIGRTDGLIPPDKLAEITIREVKEGRMSANDEIHTMALNAINGIFPEPDKSAS